MRSSLTQLCDVLFDCIMTTLKEQVRAVQNNRNDKIFSCDVLASDSCILSLQGRHSSSTWVYTVQEMSRLRPKKRWLIGGLSAKKAQWCGLTLVVTTVFEALKSAISVNPWLHHCCNHSTFENPKRRVPIQATVHKQSSAVAEGRFISKHKDQVHVSTWQSWWWDLPCHGWAHHNCNISLQRRERSATQIRSAQGIARLRSCRNDTWLEVQAK